MKYPKRLIEVDLPIKRISAHARREKSIRHGHISTLHIWWARRPLAACRAVICASLWPDPADELCPQAFRDAAAEIMFDFCKTATTIGTAKEVEPICSPESWAKYGTLAKDDNKLDPTNTDHQQALRYLLLDFIADGAAWEASTDAVFLDTARKLTQAAHEALGGAPGTRPLVVDPFAGGGAIPLEALRVGADAFASDLNPVPLLLNKVVLEYIPKYGKRLAGEVRKWGQWVKEQAEEELAPFYPKDADGNTPITYLWARTIACEGPGCGVEVPLVRSLWLCKKSNRKVALKLVPRPRAKRVDIEVIEGIKPTEIGNGTVARGSATCPVCGYTTAVSSVRRQLKERNGGADTARLLCVVATHPREQGRLYRKANEKDLQVARAACDRLGGIADQADGDLSILPKEPTPAGGGRGAGRAFSQRNYGMDRFADLFTSRQLLSMVALAKYIRLAGEKLAQEHDQGLAEAVQTLLAFPLSKQADLGNALCRWEPVAQCPRQLFGRQAIGMVWDFAEGVPIGDSSGAFSVFIRNMDNTLFKIGNEWLPGQVDQADAANHPLPNDSVKLFVTDPPYYDAVPYADLSDFFYVWLRRSLPQSTRDRWFADELAPKDQECVVDEVKGHDKAFFEATMARAMKEGRRVLAPDGIGNVVFAHKTTGGWEAQLQAMVDAGWIVTGSWPVDTECGSRLRAMDSAALASSVHIVVRPRENEDGSVRMDDVGDWREVLQDLPVRIHEWMPRLAEEGVVGADAIFACLGPALEIFSRYSRVEKASGEEVTLREYLEHVWAAVSQEALQMVFRGADATGFEEDARLTAMWLWTLGAGGDGNGESDDERTVASTGYGLEFDAARKIAQGLGAHLEQLTSLVEVHGDTARLLPVSERAQSLFGKGEATATTTGKKAKKKQRSLFEMLDEDEQQKLGMSVEIESAVSKIGETTLDRVHQAMLLFAAGRSQAVRRFLVEDGVGADGRFWTLAQALSALYPSSSEEKRWVDGILARKKSLGF